MIEQELPTFISDDTPIPMPRSRWLHITTGNHYTIVCVSNLHSSNHQKYPVTVSYQDRHQRVWSRPIEQFLKSFKED